MTNAEKIRSMNDEQLADFLHGIVKTCVLDMGCDDCPLFDCCSIDKYDQAEWLAEEAQNADYD